MYRSLHDNIFGEIIDMKTAHEIWSYLNEKYGTVSDDDDEPKMDAHECVEHNHNLVIVEDCSTSWSSDDDDDHTTRSLDKIDDVTTSDANDDATPYTLDDDNDGSCSGLRVMFLQALQLHHIALFHKEKLRYLMQM